MISYTILLIALSVISFLLGWLYARKKNKHENDTAIMVVANLKATIEIYKVTNEEQKKYLTQKNDELKKEIERLKK